MLLRRAAAAAFGLVLLGSGAFGCERAERGTERPSAAAAQSPAAPSPRPPGSVPSPRPPGYLTGVAARSPTGLRLLARGWLVDVDRGVQAATSVPVTGWLHRPGRDPLLIEDRRRAETVGPIGVSTRTEPRLPGRPRVAVLTGAGLGSVAPSADGDGLWVEEYLSRTRCTLREVGPGGGVRRAARPIACGTRPIGETREGLWLSVGPDAFTAAVGGSGPEPEHARLVDPATLAERLRVARVDLIDARRAVVFPETPEGDIELRQAGAAGAGAVTRLTRPPAFGWRSPLVGPPSPDGRWLPFRFGTPSQLPQVLDVWLLDLTAPAGAGAWRHVPSTPVFVALKGTDLGWARDGRLVIAGTFYEPASPQQRRRIATWRPGDGVLSTLPFDRQIGPFLDW
ncbi:MAG TPA: hypothetical protein VHI50_13525 [Micromonosporaceae bacterium]|jgi:hypothetical protein|nr:hypothetical protein [Micromonosporaceae bacterium]